MLRHPLVAAWAVVALSLAACATDDNASRTTGTAPGPSSPGFNEPTDPFYQAPERLQGAKPGTLIRQEIMDGAPDGAQAYRVLYHSTGLDGENIAVSGVVIVPSGDAPSSGRPILSWAHGTTGVVDRCAPSVTGSVFGLPGLPEMLAAGYVVAATDYEGLGTAGVHPFLVGESEGRGVLDAARAASQIAGADTSGRLLIWGHSQGGHASLFAGQLQASYAQEFDLVAVAAAAPAGELREIRDNNEKEPQGVIIGAYVINAYYEIYGPTRSGLEPSDALTSDGLANLSALVELCVGISDQLDEMVKIALPLSDSFFQSGVFDRPAWREALDDNTPGQVEMGSPILISQGDADRIVVPSTTTDLVEALCDQHDTVELKSYTGVNHEEVPTASLSDTMTFFADQLTGAEATSTCA